MNTAHVSESIRRIMANENCTTLEMQEALFDLVDAEVQKARAQLAAIQSVPPEARAVEAAKEIACKYHYQFDNSFIRKELAAIIQRTCFPPGEGEEWALHAVHDIQTLTRLWVESDEEQKAAAIILKHAPARPTAAREDTARLDDYVRALAWLEEHVSRGRGTLELGITEDGNIGIWINGFDKSDHAIGSGVDLYSAIDAAMQQGGKTP